MTGPTFVVLEEHSPAELDAAVGDLQAPGSRIERGWRRPVPGVQLICVGEVRTASDAAAAVMCAIGGAHLVVAANGPRDVTDRLCDDLRHLGSLEHRIGRAESVTLPEDQRRLMGLLLGGSTLGQAASALHISRRTADRRLAAARDTLGAQTTSEAVAAAARLGIRPVQR